VFFFTKSFSRPKLPRSNALIKSLYTPSHGLWTLPRPIDTATENPSTSIETSPANRPGSSAKLASSLIFVLHLNPTSAWTLWAFHSHARGRCVFALF
jgi:hypothetical protein